MKKYEVNFANQNFKISVDEGTLLSKACDEAGFSLDLVCGGRGTCGKCKVRIEKDGEIREVLSCTARVESDMNVFLTGKDYSRKAGILESNVMGEVMFNPYVVKTFVQTKDITYEKSGEYLRNCDLSALKKFSDIICDEKCTEITIVKYEGKIIDVQPGNTLDILYGAAVDIGTTTVVAYIYDLKRGMLLKTYSGLNKQISCGADIISRIKYAGTNEGLESLNKSIISTINELFAKACEELEDFEKNLYNIVLCGNSAMQHLFFGLRPDSLGYSPFTCMTKDYIECFGHETGLKCAERCRIAFLPLLGSFVGADTTSVLLTVEDDGRNRLIIDLGTNGEIAAGNIRKYYVASTSCGPAFEGGSIECGMRGTEGAVERLRIKDGRIELGVIGDCEPEGICGSGIIDAAAELLRENIIDKTGRMLSEDEYKAVKPQSPLSKNLKKVDGNNTFIIYEGRNKSVYITQKDIRQIQLAKSSIYSGCISLLKACGLSIDEIDEIVTAGAFGNYVDIESAVYIGLLPDRKGITKPAGNAAGSGVSMFLLDRSMRIKCDEIAANTVHYDLADDKDFYDSFIENMNF